MSSSIQRAAPLRRLGHYPLVMAMLLVFTGCLTFETLIKVKADGSGTVEQTFLFTNDMIRMALMFGNEDGEPVSLCDEEDLAAEAAAMGEGVRLIASEAIDTEEALGCRAVFAFDDVNTLRVDFNPENQMPAGLTSDEAAAEGQDEEALEEKPEEEYVTFRFDPGRPATLVVSMNQDLENKAAEEEDQAEEAALPTDSTQRAQQMQLMREMFKGARFAVIMEVDGTVTETDASFHDGNRITLMDIDFNKLLEDEASLEKIADANPQNTDEMKALMAGVEGIRFETNETFSVRFE